MAVRDPEDRANFTGVNPDLLSGYLKAQQELAQQGIHLFTSGRLSGYRTTGQQAGLYADRKNNPNPVAPSGYSEHEHGNALDLSVTGAVNDVTHPTVLATLKKYGLVHRYANDRPHFSYQGAASGSDDQTDAAFQALTGGQPAATGGEDQTDAAFQALTRKPYAKGGAAPVLPRVGSGGFGGLHQYESEQSHGRRLKIPPTPGVPTAPANFDTPLTPAEEQHFQAWKKQYAPHDSGVDYDLRGAFKAGLRPDPRTGHWPDTFKKPNHPTFSNESQYAAFGKPGHWEGDRFVPASGQAAPPVDAAALSRQLDTERLFVEQEQKNLKSLRALIDSGTADNAERLAYNDRVNALSERTARYQSLYAQYQSLPAGQIPRVQPVQYHPPPEAQALQHLEDARKRLPSANHPVASGQLDQQIGIAHAHLANTFPARLAQITHDAQSIQQQDKALAALVERANKGELSPAGVAQLNRALRQHQINIGANQMTAQNLQEEAAHFDKFVKSRGTNPLFPIGQFPEEIAGLGPAPTTQQTIDAFINKARHYLTPVAGVYERANLPRALLAEQLAGRLPPLPPLPTGISQADRERLIREKNDLSQLVDQETAGHPMSAGQIRAVQEHLLTPWQQQLLPVLRAQRQAIERAREIAGVNKGAYIDVGAQTAALILGGAVGGRVETALAGRLAPYLFRGVAEPALVGPAEVAARLFVARGLPRIASQAAATATAGATITGISAAAIGPQPLDKNGQPRAPTVAERAAFAGKAALASVPLNLGFGAVVGATSFALGTVKVLLSSHWTESGGPPVVQMLVGEAERRAAAAGAPLSAEESSRFGQRVEAILRAPLAAKPTGWRALASEWNGYLQRRLAAAPGGGAPGAGPPAEVPPLPLPPGGEVPGAGPVVGPIAVSPAGVSLDLRTRPLEDLQQTLGQFSQLKATGQLTPEQEAHYAVLDRFLQAHTAYQAQQSVALATPEAGEAIKQSIGTTTGYGRSGLADLDRDIEALQRRGNTGLAAKLEDAKAELYGTITQTLNRSFVPPGHPLTENLLPPVQASVLRRLTPEEFTQLSPPVQRSLILADLNNSNAVLDPGAEPHFIIPVGVKNDKELRTLADNQYRLASSHLALMFPEPVAVAPAAAPGAVPGPPPGTAPAPTATAGYPRPVTLPEVKRGTLIGFPNGFVVRITGPAEPVGPSTGAGPVAAQYPGVVVEQGHSPHPPGKTSSFLGHTLLGGNFLDPAQYPEVQPSPTTPVGTPTGPPTQPTAPTAQPPGAGPGAPASSSGLPESGTPAPTSGQPSPTTPTPSVTGGLPPSAAPGSTAAGALPVSAETPPTPSAPSRTTSQPRPLTAADLVPGAHVRAVSTGIDYRLQYEAGASFRASVLSVPSGSPTSVAPGQVRSLPRKALLEPDRFLFIPEAPVPAPAPAAEGRPLTEADLVPLAHIRQVHTVSTFETDYRLLQENPDGWSAVVLSVPPGQGAKAEPGDRHNLPHKQLLQPGRFLFIPEEEPTDAGTRSDTTPTATEPGPVPAGELGGAAQEPEPAAPPQGPQREPAPGQTTPQLPVGEGQPIPPLEGEALTRLRENVETLRDHFGPQIEEGERRFPIVDDPASGQVRFQGAHGSIYDVKGVGTLRLYKGKTGEDKYTPSTRTLYMDQDDALNLANTFYAGHKEGQHAKLDLSDPHRPTVVVTSPGGKEAVSRSWTANTEPALGLAPLEVFETPETISLHPGHFISRIGYAPSVPAATPQLPVGEPLTPHTGYVEPLYDGDLVVGLRLRDPRNGEVVRIIGPEREHPTLDHTVLVETLVIPHPDGIQVGDRREIASAELLDHWKRFQPLEGGFQFEEPAPAPEVTQPVEPTAPPTQASKLPYPTTPEEPLPRPFLNLVDAILARINRQMTANEPIFTNNIALEAFASEIMGGSRAAGTYHAQTIYNALEAAVNRYVVEQEFGKQSVRDALTHLQDLLKLLPTQTLRAEDKDALQQFSTPPTYALLATWALQAKPGEDLLEPSAGTGGLLAMAESVWGDHLAGTVANEIDPERRAILRTFFTNSTYGVDARYLHSMLPHGYNFDLVLMNPPFSSAPGQRARNTNEIGFDHVTQALSRLRPGGRLVALLGRGAAMERPTAADFWRTVQDKYTVRANIGLPGKDYEKYGTGFETQLVVIDNTGPTGTQPIWTDTVKSVEAALEGLDERGITDRQPGPGGPGSAPVTGAGPAPQPTQPGPEPGPAGQPAGNGGGGAGARAPAGGTERGPRVGGRSGPGPVVAPQPGPETTGPVVGGGVPEPAPGAGGEPQPAPGAGPTPRPVSEPTPATAVGGQPTGHVEPAPPATAPPTPVVAAPEPKPAKKKKETPAESLEPEQRQDVGDQYVSYLPAYVFEGRPHPAIMVETRSMAAQDPPPITVTHSLKKQALYPDKQLAEEFAKLTKRPVPNPEDLGLSHLQLEAALYAKQRHAVILPDGSRAGFLLGDGTGCIAPGTRIYNPLTGTETAVEELARRGERHPVLSMTPDGLRPHWAEAPFIKGTEDLYRVVLESGREVTVTAEHRFLTPQGWLRLADGLQPGHFLACAADPLACNSEAYRSTHDAGDPRWSRRPEDCLDRYSSDRRPDDGPPQWDRDSGLAPLPLPAGASERIQHGSRMDDPATLPAGSRSYPLFAHRSRSSSSPWATRGHGVSEAPASASASQPSAGSRRASWRSLELTGAPQPTGAASSRQSEPLLVGSAGQLPRSRIGSEHRETRGTASPGRDSFHRSTRVRVSELPSDNRERCDGSGLHSVPVPELFSSYFYYSRWDRIAEVEHVGVGLYYDLHVPGPENYVAEGVVHHNSGKGRTIAAIIADAWENNTRRILWFSARAGLEDAARDDLAAIGYGHIPIKLVTKISGQEPIDPKFEGIIFSTYNALSVPAKTGTLKNKKRREQLELWINSPREEGGEDTQGEGSLVVWDESHKMKNSVQLRGMPPPSETARDGLRLQNNLPKMRVVYSSATAMTDLENMAYLQRLGIWGRGTPWTNFGAFAAEMGSGGRGYLEMVARDLKGRGVYLAREISYKDPEDRPDQSVEFRSLTHTLDSEDLRKYTLVAQAWQVVLQNFEAAIEITGTGKGAKRAALSAFWSSHQRFFRQFLTALKLPTLYADIDAQLAAGRSVIISLIGTGESAENEAVREAIAAGLSLDDLDLTPIQGLVRLVDKAFPTQQFVEELAPGAERPTMVPLFDADGNPVHNPDALARKEALLERLASITDRLPGNPLNEILWHYGHNNVAELTGRRERLEPGPEGQIIRVSRGGANINVMEKDRFNAGEKRIAIISTAANEGISLQAGRRFKNQQRRVQYMFELNWSADQQMQANGRSHRSNQVSAPELVIVNTNAGGEVRFASTIARRLASLGALTRGERSATGAAGALDQFDFENNYGRTALDQLYSEILRSGSVPGLADARQALRDMGVLQLAPLTGYEGIDTADRVNITRFMNRLLSLEVERQNPLFERFAYHFAANVQAAQDAGEFDFGVEDIRGANIREEGQPQIVHTDPDTGAVTTYHHVIADEPTHPVTLAEIDRIAEVNRVGWLVRDRDNKVFYGIRTQSPSHPTRLLSPGTRDGETITGDAQRTHYTQLRATDKIVAARNQWEEEVAKVPKTRPRSYHLVAGTVLQQFDRLNSSGQRNFSVRRAKLPSGQRIVGIALGAQFYKRILQALGATAGATDMAGTYERLYAGEEMKLVSGLKLRRSTRSGQPVVLIEGAEVDLIGELAREGFSVERDAATRRYFVWISADPTRGVPQLTYLLNRFPPMDAAAPAEGVVAQTVPRLAPPSQRGLRQISPKQIPLMVPPRWTIPFETLRFLEARGDQISTVFRQLAEYAFPEQEVARLHDFGFVIWPEVQNTNADSPSFVGGINVIVSVAGAEPDLGDPHSVFVNPFPPDYQISPHQPLRRGEGLEYQGLKETDNPDLIATHIVNAMVHELAHLRTREEGTSIIEAMEDLFGAIGPEETRAVEEAIKRAITDTSGKLSAEYRSARKGYYAKARAERRPSPVGWAQGTLGPGSALGQIVPSGGGGGNAPVGGGGGNAPRRKRAGEGHRTALYTLPHPGAEAQFSGARPTKEPPLEWFKRARAEIGHFFTRVYPHLPANDPFYAEFRYKLLEMEKGWHIAQTNAVLILKQTLDDLSPQDYSFFQRAVYVLDLEEEVSRQVAAVRERLGDGATNEAIARHVMLPTGDGSPEQAWTPERVGDIALEIRKELEKPESQSVVEAMEIRRHLLDTVKDRLLTEMQKATGRTRVLDREEYFHHEILFYMLETMTQRGGGSSFQAPGMRGFMQRRIGSLLNYDSDFVSAETAWLVPAIFDTMLYELMSFIRDQYDIRKELQKLALQINDETLMEAFEHLAEARNARLKGNQKPITAEEIYRSRFNSTIAQGFFRLGKIAHERPDWLPGHDDERWQELIEEIGAKWFMNEDAKDIGGEPIPMDAEYFRQFWQYLTWLLTPPQAGQAGSGAAGMIFKGIREKRAAIKAELGSKHVTWRDLLHGSYQIGGETVDFRDYTTFSPEKGNVLYRAWSVRDRIANSVIEAGLDGIRLELKPDDLKKLLVVGGKKPEWVIPKTVAATLNEFRNPGRDEFDKFLARAGGGLKEWILLNPFHWFAYNLRNEFTDIEVVGAANPYALQYVRKAALELAQFMFKREVPSDDLREWLDRGGNVATLLAANTGWRSSGTLDMLKHLRENQTFTQKTFNRAWKGFKITTDFREAILRYAAYLSYRDQMNANGGVPKNFGASHEDEIMALPEIGQRAFALSNELLGAYDQVPQFFKKVRGVLPMPFLSWKVINTRRYWRLASNEFATAGGYGALLNRLLDFAALEETEPDRRARLLKVLADRRALAAGGGGKQGGGGDDLGGGGGDDGTGNGPFDPDGPEDDADGRKARDAFRRLRREARGKRNSAAWMLARLGLGPVAALFIARFFLKVMWMNWMATAYNWAFHRDQEMTTPPFARWTPHVDWGKLPGGLYGYTDRISGVADAGGTFGLDDIMGYREKYNAGHMTIGQVLLDMAVRSPTQTFIDQVGFPRFMFELATRKQLFPDFTKPRDIRDRGEFVFNAIGMGKFYLGWKGIPQRGGTAAIGWQMLGATLFHPGESQYDETRELAIDWAQKNKFGDTGSPSETEKGKLAYWVKRSLKFGDPESALHFMFMYWQAGGTEEGLASSFKYGYPLYRWPQVQKEAFLRSLTFAEARRYRNAMWFFQQTYAPTVEFAKGDKEYLDKQPIEDFDTDMWSRVEAEIDSQRHFDGYDKEHYPKEYDAREKLLESVGKSGG